MEEYDVIDLKEVFHILKKGKYILVIIPLISMLVGAVVSFFVLVPVYRTSTTVMVGRANAGTGVHLSHADILAAERLVRTYSAIAESRVVAEEVLASGGLDMTIGELMAKIETAPVRDTMLIEIAVSDADPVQAALLANKTADVFIERVTEITLVDNVKVVDKAIAPFAHAQPNERLNIIIAGVLGFMVATGLVFLREFLDQTIKTSDDVSRYLDLPVLGSIAKMNNKEHDALHKNLITLNDPKSPVSETYRIVRTNIQFSSVDKSLKKLLITSPLMNEGKTVTSANLAVAFAKTGQRVVLVDADLRKPSQHKIFNLLNYQGLTSLLLGDVGIQEVLNETFEPTLSVITSGPIPPNPAEMLGSRKMESLLEELEGYADLIVLDMPPVTVVADTVVLAGKVDSVVMVLTSTQTLIDAAKRSKELLINSKANIIGTVLNMVDKESQDYYNYYYYSEHSAREKGRGKRTKGIPGKVETM